MSPLHCVFLTYLSQVVQNKLVWYVLRKLDCIFWERVAVPLYDLLNVNTFADVSKDAGDDIFLWGVGILVGCWLSVFFFDVGIFSLGSFLMYVVVSALCVLATGACISRLIDQIFLIRFSTIVLLLGYTLITLNRPNLDWLIQYVIQFSRQFLCSRCS